MTVVMVCRSSNPPKSSTARAPEAMHPAKRRKRGGVKARERRERQAVAAATSSGRSSKDDHQLGIIIYNRLIIDNG